MKKNGKKFYVVAEDILPEGILKTVKVKEMIRRGEATSVPDATEKLGIARSTFYKYRDGIFTFFDLRSMEISNISLILDHTPGVLSGVLGEIAKFKGNVLTINQGLPSHGTATVTLSVGTEGISCDLSELIDALLSIDGVLDARIDGVK